MYEACGYEIRLFKKKQKTQVMAQTWNPGLGYEVRLSQISIDQSTNKI